jgi:hypothetical protein
MFRYSAFGLVIESELEFAELAQASGPPDIMIRSGRVPRTAHKATMDEEFAFNTHAGAFHIRGGREIIFNLLDDVDLNAARILLLGKMMAFLLRQRGWLALHASGIEIGGEAILFLGPSGCGKSTTAAAFHARGHRVITDDVAAVRLMDGGCRVQPAGTPVRLPADARHVLSDRGLGEAYQYDKHAFRTATGSPQPPLTVSRICLLDYTQEFRDETVPPLHSVALLSGNSFVRRRRMSSEALDCHLRDCVSVASVVPVHRLFRPRSLESVGELVRWIEKRVERELAASV